MDRKLLVSIENNKICTLTKNEWTLLLLEYSKWVRELWDNLILGFIHVRRHGNQAVQTLAPAFFGAEKILQLLNSLIPMIVGIPEKGREEGELFEKNPQEEERCNCKIIELKRAEYRTILYLRMSLWIKTSVRLLSFADVAQTIMKKSQMINWNCILEASLIFTINNNFPTLRWSEKSYKGPPSLWECTIPEQPIVY